MKKICIDARMALHSGIGTYIRNLLPYLQQAYPLLKVLAPSSICKEWDESHHYDLIFADAPIYSIQEQWEIPRLIPSCDLFWSPHYNIPLLPLRAKKRLVTIHDVCHLAYKNHLSVAKRAYAKFMLGQAVTRSHHIVTISEFSKQEMVSYLGVDQRKMTVIPLAVSEKLLSAAAQQKKESSCKDYFLFVSTLTPHKNLHRLLRAWEKVIANYPHYQLIVIGKKVQSTQEENFHPSVVHLENVKNEELAIFYQNATALIYPSLYEGFGLPPLEAMALGCPTIVANGASLPEVCGDASLYIDPLSERDMIEKISQLIENPSLRLSLITQGQLRVNQFSWKKTAMEHVSIIDQLTQG